jgi:hypothetical protein
MAMEMRAQGEVLKPECFVIMPVSDPEGYPLGHFRHVFNDIFVPACEIAGYRAVRADQVKETNLIHLDILQRLLSSPIVLCDLSSSNPNVLFELGLRQAFDKPVVLVQEQGTPRIFDVAPLRYIEYRQAHIYHEVIEDQLTIANTITATMEAFNKGQGVNSMVRILSLTKPASFVEIQGASKDPSLQLIRAELSELRSEVQRAMITLSSAPVQPDSVPVSQDVKLLQQLSREIETRLGYMKATGDIDTGVPDLLGTLKALAQKLAGSAQQNSEWQQIAHITSKIKIFEQLYLSLTGQPIWQSLEKRGV